MKRITMATALVLCLILSVFAFASCGKKNNTASTTADATAAATTAGTTASIEQTTGASAETEPEATTAPTAAETTVNPFAHVHVPESEYWIDLEPTCITPGQKSLYCEECGEQIEDSIVEIPIDPNAHNIPEWTVVKQATLFEDGTRSGFCVICEQTLTETYSSLVEVYYSEDLKTEKLIVGTNIYNDLLEGGGKHFYPTADNPFGNDLFVEYSLLWNTTLANLTSYGGYETISARVTNANDSSSGNDLIWMSLKDNAANSDCHFAGGFEYGGLRTVEVGPSGMVPPCGSTYADYPNIGGADQANPEWGWHRIGVRLHEELTNEDEVKAGEKAKYLVWAECYIDGVLSFKLSTRTASTYKDINLLFTAESDGNGGITYTDIDESKCILGILCTAKEATGAGAFLVYGDYCASAGNSFTQKVTRVDNPAANVYTASDGTEISAPFYYALSAN